MPRWKENAGKKKPLVFAQKKKTSGKGELADKRIWHTGKGSKKGG